MPATPLRTLAAAVVAALVIGVVPPAAVGAQLPTTTTLQAPAGPIGIFDPLSFLALVRPSPDDGGTVTLVKDGVGLVDDEITPNGAANLSLPDGLRAGTHTFKAVFNGTTSSAPSTSDDLVIEVVDDLDVVIEPTATTAAVSPRAIRIGDIATIGVSVSPSPVDLPLVEVSVDHPTLADWLVAVDLDAAGSGSVEFDSTGWPEGVFDVRTTFGGTDRLAASTHTTSITIDSTAPAGSISIAGGAANTLTTAVMLAVPATDALSGVTQVELSNNGVSWSARAYAPTQAWTLSAGDGIKNVYARWKDAAGNWSFAEMDQIHLGVPLTPPPPDVTPPTGSISIAGGAAYTRTRFLTVATPATDDRGDVIEMALSNDGTTWTTGGYAPTRNWTLDAIDGTRTVHVRWKDAAGNWSAVKTDTIVLDTVKPSVTVPLRRFMAATGIDAGRIGVRVPWSASDDRSGIARYELEQSTGGVWAMVSTTLTSPSITRLLATQQDYQFRVRAVDGAGNTSVATGKPFRISRYSEHNSAIRYSGSWSNDSNPAYWGGAARRSSAAGARASLTFTGRHFAWVARTGPDRGKAGIFVNGTQVATVDLYAPTTRAQRVVWVGTWTTAISRTITIRVAGTSGRPRIDLDALVTAD